MNKGPFIKNEEIQSKYIIQFYDPEMFEDAAWDQNISSLTADTKSHFIQDKDKIYSLTKMDLS